MQDDTTYGSSVSSGSSRQLMYHITYLSDGLKVKGYLCFPYGFDLPVPELKASISRFYASNEAELPITKIASSIDPETKDVRPFKWPVLIYCRGGIGKIGRVKTHWLEQFSKFGHIIFAPSYRGTEGGEGRDEFGGQDKDDVLSAYKLLQSLPFVDSSRISVMGFSRGSINAAHTAAEIAKVHKLIFWSGVSDLAQTYAERIDLRRMLKRVIGGSLSKKPDAYESRSPASMAARIHCPTLIMHGTQDIQVDFSHGVNMYNKLREAGAEVEFHKYEGYGHHFPPDVHRLAIERMFHWINN